MSESWSVEERTLSNSPQARDVLPSLLLIHVTMLTPTTGPPFLSLSSNPLLVSKIGQGISEPDQQMIAEQPESL